VQRIGGDFKIVSCCAHEINFAIWSATSGSASFSSFR
jgi:hypothetical protein